MIFRHNKLVIQSPLLQMKGMLSQSLAIPDNSDKQTKEELNSLGACQ